MSERAGDNKATHFSPTLRLSSGRVAPGDCSPEGRVRRCLTPRHSSKFGPRAGLRAIAFPLTPADLPEPSTFVFAGSGPCTSHVFAGLEVRRLPSHRAWFTTPRIRVVIVPEREKTVRKPEESPKQAQSKSRGFALLTLFVNSVTDSGPRIGEGGTTKYTKNTKGRWDGAGKRAERPSG